MTAYINISTRLTYGTVQSFRRNNTNPTTRLSATLNYIDQARVFGPSQLAAIAVRIYLIAESMAPIDFQSFWEYSRGELPDVIDTTRYPLAAPLVAEAAEILTSLPPTQLKAAKAFAKILLAYGASTRWVRNEINF